MKNLTLAIAAVSVGLTGIATPAFAQSVDRKVELVKYDDLNLNTEAGQKTLEIRVARAARRVCSMNRGMTDARSRQFARECHTKARASAMQQVAAVIQDERRGG